MTPELVFALLAIVVLSACLILSTTPQENPAMIQAIADLTAAVQPIPASLDALTAAVAGRHPSITPEEVAAVTAAVATLQTARTTIDAATTALSQ